jgi:hypothetical protein
MCGPASQRSMNLAEPPVNESAGDKSVTCVNAD